MNPGLLGFPPGRVLGTRDRYRFLPCDDLPAYPGDVARFDATKFNPTAGALLPGRWRPIDATNVATVAVERGCLVVAHAPLVGFSVLGAGAAYSSPATNLDVVLTLLVQPPLQFPSGDDESFWVGAFMGVGTSAVGYCMACVDSDVGGLTASNQSDTLVTTFSFDPTLASLPFTPDNGVRVTPWPQQAALFVRLKRRGAEIRTYFSADGFTWRESESGSGRETGLDPVAPTIIGVLVNAQMATPSGKVKAFIPELKYFDPNTEFLE